MNQETLDKMRRMRLFGMSTLLKVVWKHPVQSPILQMR
jgi:hypothetical protein